MLGLGLGLNKGTIIKSLIQELKSAGAIFVYLSNKANGVGPLTGNDSPFKDLIGANDGILLNFAGTVGSGWNTVGDVSYLTFDGIDDVIRILTESSGDVLDITTGNLGLAAVYKPQILADSQYLLYRNLDSFGSGQYGLRITPGNIGIVLNGSIKKTITSTNDIYNSLLYHWSGTEVVGYKNNVLVGLPEAVVGPLISRPNLEFGARSNAVDGSAYSFFFKGDCCATAIFNGSDHDAMNTVWSKISDEYLVLNP